MGINNFTLVTNISPPGGNNLNEKERSLWSLLKNNAKITYSRLQGGQDQYFIIDRGDERKMDPEEIELYKKYQKQKFEKTKSQVTNIVSQSLLKFGHILPEKLERAAAPLAGFIELTSMAPFMRGVVMLAVACLLQSSEQAFTDYINSMILLKKYTRLITLLNPIECFKHKYITAQGARGGNHNLLDTEHIKQMTILHKCNNMTIDEILQLKYVKEYTAHLDEKETDSDVYTSATLLMNTVTNNKLIPSFASKVLRDMLTKSVLNENCDKIDPGEIVKILQKYNNTSIYIQTDEWGEHTFAANTGGGAYALPRGVHDMQQKRNNTSKSNNKTLRKPRYKLIKSKKSKKREPRIKKCLYVKPNSNTKKKS